MKKHIIYYLFAASFAVSCSRYPADVERALKLAGDNRAEFEKVLEHYRQHPQDSLKYRAACFLIENMPGHGSYIQRLISPSGNIYTDFIAGKKEYDSLARMGFRIEKVIEPDILHVSYDFLVKQIEWAFEAWRKPWSCNVSFDDFCRYILPYRAQVEPLTSMRGEFFRSYGHILDTISGLTCPVEACRIINRMLMDSIRYHVDLMNVPVTRTVEDTKNSGLGQCDDLCNFGIHVMRSAGIPVVVEITLWPRMNAGHSWCSVLGSDGIWYAFGAGEDQPGELVQKFASRQYCTFAKVYRFTYEYQKNTRRDSMLKNTKIVAMFSSVFVRDITDEYIHTQLVTVNVDSHEEYAFLCVFNHGKWQAVDYSSVKQGQASFRAGNNVIYMPHVVRNGVLHPCGEPFLLESDSVIKLIPDLNRLCSATLKKKTAGDDRLFYWDAVAKTWKQIHYSSSSETNLFYDSIPYNALLWHYIPQYLQRPGIVVDGSYKNY